MGTGTVRRPARAVGSCRYLRASCGIEFLAGWFDGGDEIGVAHGGGLYEIHVAAEERFEVFDEAEVAVVVFGGGAGLEGDQEVEVAVVGIEVGGGGGADEVELGDTVVLAEGDDGVVVFCERTVHGATPTRTS